MKKPLKNASSEVRAYASKRQVLSRPCQPAAGAIERMKMATTGYFQGSTWKPKAPGRVSPGSLHASGCPRVDHRLPTGGGGVPRDSGISGEGKSIVSSAGVQAPIFAEDALEAIAIASGGPPRKVNLFAEKALILGVLSKKQAMDSEVIQKVHQELAPFALWHYGLEGR